MKLHDDIDDAIYKILADLDYDVITTDNTGDAKLYNNYVTKDYVDSNIYMEKTTEEILDELPVEEIENYLRKKKLNKIKNKM